MEEENSNQLLNNHLNEKTLNNIYEQLESMPNPHTKSEDNLINDRTLCAPTCKDIYHLKEPAIKIAAILCCAGLLDGGITFSTAALTCFNNPVVCSPIYQGIIAPVSCCFSWVLNYIPLENLDLD